MALNQNGKTQLSLAYFQIAQNKYDFNLLTYEKRKIKMFSLTLSLKIYFN